MSQNDALDKYRQADALMGEERYEEALALLDELYAAYPNEKELIYTRAMCLEKVDRKQEAWGLAKRLIELHDDPRGREIQTRLEGPQQPFATDAAGTAMPTAAPADPFDIRDVMAPPPPIEVASAKSGGGMKYVVMAVVVLLLLVGATLLAVLDGDEDRSEPAASGRPSVTTAQPQTGPVSIKELEPGQIPAGLVAAFLVILLMTLALGPVPLYLTLLFTGNLPGGTFLAVYLKVLLVWLGVSLLASFCPCIGWIAAIYILYKVYDLGFVDFVILFALSAVFWFVLQFIMRGILLSFGFVV